MPERYNKPFSELSEGDIIQNNIRQRDSYPIIAAIQCQGKPVSRESISHICKILSFSDEIPEHGFGYTPAEILAIQNGIKLDSMSPWAGLELKINHALNIGVKDGKIIIKEGQAIPR